MTDTPNKTTSILMFRPHAGDDGKQIGCRAENRHFLGGMLEDRKRLDVACKWPVRVGNVPEAVATRTFSHAQPFPFLFEPFEEHTYTIIFV